MRNFLLLNKFFAFLSIIFCQVFTLSASNDDAMVAPDPKRPNFTIHQVLENWNGFDRSYLKNSKVVIVDTETTGGSVDDRICEIGLFLYLNGRYTGTFMQAYLNPGKKSSYYAYKAHRLSHEFLKSKLGFADVAHDLREFLDGALVIAHNASFDVRMIENEFRRLDVNSGIEDFNIFSKCTLAMARRDHKRTLGQIIESPPPKETRIEVGTFAEHRKKYTAKRLKRLDRAAKKESRDSAQARIRNQERRRLLSIVHAHEAEKPEKSQKSPKRIRVEKAEDENRHGASFSNPCRALVFDDLEEDKENQSRLANTTSSTGAVLNPSSSLNSKPSLKLKNAAEIYGTSPENALSVHGHNLPATLKSAGVKTQGWHGAMTDSAATMGIIHNM